MKKKTSSSFRSVVKKTLTFFDKLILEREYEIIALWKKKNWVQYYRQTGRGCSVLIIDKITAKCLV